VLLFPLSYRQSEIGRRVWTGTGTSDAEGYEDTTKVCQVVGVPLSNTAPGTDLAGSKTMVFLKVSQPTANNDQGGAATKTAPVTSMKPHAGAQSAKKVDSTLITRATLMGRDIATALVGGPETNASTPASSIDAVAASLRDLKVDGWEADNSAQTDTQIHHVLGTNQASGSDDTTSDPKDCSVLLRGLPSAFIRTSSADWFAIL
jgi:hypothetical protein